jgi:NAD(P)-dependent dehydrogenase (short-subunit alcohol dehydrogenase family)
MEIDLKDHVVFITGSARRVGKAIALEFARQGANLVIHHSQSDEQAEETAQEARGMGVDALVVKGDHSRHEDIAANFAALEAHYGRLDGLVNSAGIFQSGDILDISSQDWEQVIALNLSAPFYCTQFAGRLMRRGGRGGFIINIGDNGGLRPWHKRPHHSISKAGVIMLTEVSARALAAFQIRVNCLVPGPVLPSPGMDQAYWEKVVRRLPLGRDGDPADVGRAAVFLAKNDFITGAILRVDGGEYLGAI